MQKSVAVVAVLFAIPVLPAISQTSDSPGNTTPKVLTWDVVSIKPHKQLDNSSTMQWTSDGIELPVYNLVVAKQGLKLKESAEDGNGMSSMGQGKLTAHRSQIGNLAFRLSATVSRVIIDKTGLTALYDIDLTWSPDNEPDTGPSIFTALEEQLGLKLESAKAPIDVVVIDHIERPSAN